MRALGGCLSALVLLLIGCVGEVPADGAPPEWCSAELDCLLSATSAAEADACTEGDTQAMPWVADLNWCAMTVCEASCQGDLVACKSCIASACPEAQRACDGYDALAYLDQEGFTCDDIWDCWGRCGDASDMECLSECYWSASPGQRAAFQEHAYRLESRCHGLCDYPNAGCDWCFRELAPSYDCYDYW